MERRALRGHLEGRSPLRFLRRRARRLCLLHDVPPVTVYVRRKRGMGGSYVCDAVHLDPGCGVNLLSLLHELAHHITEHRHPAAQKHGPAWVRWYGHLLDAERLVPLPGFRALCRQYDVRY